MLRAGNERARARARRTEDAAEARQAASFSSREKTRSTEGGATWVLKDRGPANWTLNSEHDIERIRRELEGLDAASTVELGYEEAMAAVHRALRTFLTAMGSMIATWLRMYIDDIKILRWSHRNNDVLESSNGIPAQLETA